jgi:hypothetical protein
VTRLAVALRGYGRDEREKRLEALRATIRAEERGPVGQVVRQFDGRLYNVVGAFARGNALASATTFEALVASAETVEEDDRDNFLAVLEATASFATRLLSELRKPPTLRRIK